VRLALIVLGIAAGSTSARADSVGSYGEPARPVNKDFWQEVVDPRGDEVAAVIAKINQALDVAAQLPTNDSDPDGSQRARLLDEARGMARYLRRIAPANPEVLMTLGKVTDEAGRADEALEALQAYLELEPDNGDAALRVGRIYLRLHQYDDAVRYLRIANASIGWMNAGVYLASALTATGRDDEAIRVLESAAGLGNALAWGGMPQLPAFALAVAYDRDEQITEAFGVLDMLQSQLQTGFMSELQRQLDTLQLTPPGEAHYYRALLYESSGYLDEARASWLVYAGGDNARFRHRALAHVAAIDLLVQRAIAARKPGKAKARRGGAATGATGGAGGGVIQAPPPPSPRKAPRRPHRPRGTP
jgi:tetratricopeptide (TPR) repeat protein